MTPSTTTRPDSASKKLFRRAAAALFWVAAWQLAAMAIHQELYLASPATTLKTLLSLLGDGAFWYSIGYSSLRIMGGFLLGLACGILLAVLAAWSAWIRILVSPMAAAMKSIPVASFVILAIIWAGSANLAAVISFLMALPIVYINTLEGILCTDPQLLEMARVFRVPPARRVLYVYFPQLIPFVSSACSVALGLCWKSGVAAEVIGITTASLGERLYESKIYLNTGELFATTTVIVLLSVLFEKLFHLALDRLQKTLEGGRLL